MDGSLSLRQDHPSLSRNTRIARSIEMTPIDAVSQALGALVQTSVRKAEHTISEVYPFVPSSRSSRKITRTQMISVFLRDGFVDRYSGDKLVFPGALRVLSEMLPAHFPYHGNWAMDKCHIAYWDLQPTIDHLVPIARGGKDDLENWVSTSMKRNQIKAHWLLEEIGWSLKPVGHLQDWDGLLGLFQACVNQHPELLDRVPALRDWHKVVARVLPARNHCDSTP